MPVLRLLRLLVAAAFVVGALPASAALATTGGEDVAAGTTWALEPATDDDAAGRVSIRHEIEPGESVSDAVVVSNLSAHDATFAVYAGDGLVDDEGNFDILPAETAPSDGGAWVEIGEVEGATPRPGGGIVVEVPASSSTRVPLEITVPADATPGDHPAGVVAELVQGGAASLQVSSRVGVRLHLRVAGDVVAELSPTVEARWSPSWNPFAPGTVTVDYTVENTGNVRVGADVAATVTGPFGAGGGSATGERREVLPGQAASGTVHITEVWPLFRAAGELVASPGVVGEDDVDAALLPSTVTFQVWTVPWPQLLLLALLVATAVLVVRARRRAAARVQARIDAAVAAAVSARDAAATDDGAMDDAPADDYAVADDDTVAAR